MKTKQLRNRVGYLGSITSIGIATLSDYCLRFNKLSKDGSGKANIEEKNNTDTIVKGIIFNLTEEQFNELKEKWEKGYDVRDIKVINPKGDTLEVKTFIAKPENIENDLRPKCDYRQLLIKGAKEYGLDERYKKFLCSFPCTE